MKEKKEGEAPVFFRYKMRFPDDREQVFTVNLDPETLAILQPWPQEPPGWSRLDFHQCPNCPLERRRHPYCPVAVHMRELILFLQDLTSYQEVEVTVESRERHYFTRSTLQRVAGSLMGIYMTTSGCPILNKMRPMVETHLPFSTWQETIYRVMSMYLLAQYFLHKNGWPAVWDLSGLVAYYAEVQSVNVHFAQRLREVPSLEGDASINALSILASLATMASLTLEEGDLVHWERIFLTHWCPDAGAVAE